MSPPRGRRRARRFAAGSTAGSSSGAAAPEDESSADTADVDVTATAAAASAAPPHDCADPVVDSVRTMHTATAPRGPAAGRRGRGGLGGGCGRGGGAGDSGSGGGRDGGGGGGGGKNGGGGGGDDGGGGGGGDDGGGCGVGGKNGHGTALGRVRRPQRAKPSAAAPALRAAARAALRDARAAAERCDPLDGARIAALCDAASQTLDAGAPPGAVRDVALCAAAAVARLAEGDARRQNAERVAEELREKIDAEIALTRTLRAKADGAATIAACVLRTAVTFMPRLASRTEPRRPARRERRAEQRVTRDALLQLVNLPDIVTAGREANASTGGTSSRRPRVGTEARRRALSNARLRRQPDPRNTAEASLSAPVESRMADGIPVRTENEQRGFATLNAMDHLQTERRPDRDCPITRLADMAAYFGETLDDYYMLSGSTVPVALNPSGADRPSRGAAFSPDAVTGRDRAESHRDPSHLGSSGNAEQQSSV